MKSRKYFDVISFTFFLCSFFLLSLLALNWANFRCIFLSICIERASCVVEWTLKWLQSGEILRGDYIQPENYDLALFLSRSFPVKSSFPRCMIFSTVRTYTHKYGKRIFFGANFFSISSAQKLLNIVWEALSMYRGRILTLFLHTANGFDDFVKKTDELRAQPCTWVTRDGVTHNRTGLGRELEIKLDTILKRSKPYLVHEIYILIYDELNFFQLFDNDTVWHISTNPERFFAPRWIQVDHFCLLHAPKAWHETPVQSWVNLIPLQSQSAPACMGIDPYIMRQPGQT